MKPFVFGGTALLEDGFQFALLKTLTEGKKNVFQLSVHHGAVLGFVELQDFNEVLVGAGVLVLLDLSEEGHEVVELDDLLLLLLSAAKLQWWQGWGSC